MPGSSTTPLLDIIMLVHDQAGWADLAIRAVESFTKNAYRLIIVDMASTTKMAEEVFERAEYEGHTVIHLAENRSFSNGVNVGVAAGSAKFICILNDDAIVTEGWDTAMLQDSLPKHIGMVGARSNYASGAQGDPSFVGQPPYLVFVCVALRRQIWDVVGPMDEVTFDGFSSEDIDYSWRVRKAGYELKVSNAFVLHAGSRTLGAVLGAYMDPACTITTEARAKNDQKYNARLIDKWGKDFAIQHSRTKENGVVVTYHAEDWTRVEFLKNLIGLRRSDNVGFSYLQVTRTPIQMARMAAADYAIDTMGADWIVQLDDDATFPPDVLRRLLSHQKDVVCALAYQRKPPHLTCTFEVGDDGLLGKPLEGIEHTGLRRVDVSGFHCSIIRASVFKKLRAAGIKQYYGGFDNKVGEDFAMCLNLKKIGVQMYCDTELISGHIGASIVVDEAYKKSFLAQGGR
jgi:GT2 family glycosyltransferase